MTVLKLYRPMLYLCLLDIYRTSGGISSIFRGCLRYRIKLNRSYTMKDKINIKEIKKEDDLVPSPNRPCREMTG